MMFVSPRLAVLNLSLLLIASVLSSDLNAKRIFAVSYKDIQSEMNKNPGMKAMLFVHTSWCAPCKVMDKFLDSVMGQFADVLFFDVDGDKAQDIKAKYGVSCYPTIIFLDQNGKVLDTLQGGYSSAESFSSRVNEIFSGRTMRKVVSRTPQEAARNQPAPRKAEMPCVGKTKSGKVTSRCRR